MRWGRSGTDAGARRSMRVADPKPGSRGVAFILSAGRAVSGTRSLVIRSQWMHTRLLSSIAGGVGRRFPPSFQTRLDGLDPPRYTPRHRRGSRLLSTRHHGLPCTSLERSRSPSNAWKIRQTKYNQRCRLSNESSDCPEVGGGGFRTKASVSSCRQRRRLRDERGRRNGSESRPPALPPRCSFCFWSGLKIYSNAYVP